MLATMAAIKEEEKNMEIIIIRVTQRKAIAAIAIIITEILIRADLEYMEIILLANRH